MYVLDTNALIHFFKGREPLVERLLSKPRGDIGLPTVALYEIEVGVLKSANSSKRRSQLQEFVSCVRLLPFGSKEASTAAKIRVELEREGFPIGPLDNLIAGTALSHRATLVTHNLREFERVEGLTLEDWLA